MQCIAAKVAPVDKVCTEALTHKSFWPFVPRQQVTKSTCLPDLAMSASAPALDCFGCCGALPRLACPLPFVSLASLFSNWSGFSLSSAAVNCCCVLEAWPLQ